MATWPIALPFSRLDTCGVIASRGCELKNTLSSFAPLLEGRYLLMKRIFMMLALAVMLATAIALSGVAQAGTSTSTLASPTQISYVCVNKSSGQLFYLSSCTKSQTKTSVASDVPAQGQFKACFQASNGVTRKVPESTKCSNKSTNIENTIPNVPADSTSLYFCVKSSDGTMFFKPGTTEPSCPTGQYAVVIGPHNQAPSAAGDSYSVAEDGTLNFSAPGVLSNDSDPDGDTISAQLVTGPSNGTLTLNSDGSFSYTPNADYNGVDSFTYKATDSHNNLSAAATVSITVNAVDDPPVAEDDSKTVAEDSGQTPIDVLANDTDVDGGTMQIASVGNPAHGKVVVAGDNLSLSYEPAANYCGQDTFSYTLNGGSTANVSVKVTCVDDAPVAVNDLATVLEDAAATSVDVLNNDTDIDAGPKTIASATQPPNGTVEIMNNGTDLTYKPNADYCNGGSPTDDFKYKLNGGSEATAAVTVTCVNDEPKAVDDTATTDEDTPVTVPAADLLANDSAGPADESGQQLSIEEVSNSQNGQAVLNADGSITFTPAQDFYGPASFDYTVSDANGGTDTASVNLTVTPVDDPPTVTLASGGSCSTSTTGVSGTMNLSLADVDSSSGALTLNATSSPTALVPVANVQFGGSDANRTVSIAPAAEQSGSATIAIIASDGTAKSSTTTIQVVVGTDGNNAINGTIGTDMIFGLNGADIINAGNSNDLVCGGDAADVISGGAGDDTLDGANGNDALRGDAGKDIVRGSAGNDQLTGGSEADSFDGGSDTDVATDYNAEEGDTMTNIP
jgi:VCBS repeat-containing protein